MGKIWLTFVHLSRQEKWCLCEASYFLAKAKIEIYFFSFKTLAARLGDLSEGTPEIVNDIGKSLVVKRAIQRTHTLLPWENVCLPQAIAAMYMLKKRRIPASLFFGVGHQKDAVKLQAHAWVKTGDFFVTGQRGSQNYAQVAMFKSTGVQAK